MKDMLGGVDVLPFKVAAYHKANARMEFVLPGMPNSDFEFISGSRMRQMAKEGASLPPGFMSEGGLKVLGDYYRSLE